jgi:hypothetical protein
VVSVRKERRKENEKSYVNGPCPGICPGRGPDEKEREREEHGGSPLADGYDSRCGGTNVGMIVSKE